MLRRRSTYHHGALKEAVLACALAHMDRRKAADFSVPELARELGVTHSAVYKHFPNKKAIVVALAERALETFLAFAEQELPPPSAGWKAHPALADVYVRFAVENPGLFKALFHSALEDLAEYTALAAARERQFAMLLDYFARAVRVKKGVNARHAALAHWSMSHGLAVLLVDGQIPPGELTELPAGDLASALAKLLERGIRP